MNTKKGLLYEIVRRDMEEKTLIPGVTEKSVLNIEIVELSNVCYTDFTESQST